MVNLRLIREPNGVDSTYGVLFYDGYYQCRTLENTKKIIPAGIYPVTLYPSGRFKTLVPLLHKVVNRSMIEIHVANRFYELEGCIAVGLQKDAVHEMLVSSKAAFDNLMEKLKKETEIQIKVEEWL